MCNFTRFWHMFSCNFTHFWHLAVNLGVLGGVEVVIDFWGIFLLGVTVGVAFVKFLKIKEGVALLPFLFA